MDAEGQWADVVETLTEVPDVLPGSMFGCPGLRTGTKFFAMVWQERLVVKLPAARRDATLAEGGEPFEPMPGRRMGEWVLPSPTADWPALAEESRRYVESLKGR